MNDMRLSQTCNGNSKATEYQTDNSMIFHAEMIPFIIS